MNEFQQWVMDAAIANGWTVWPIAVPSPEVPGSFRLYLLLVCEEPARLILADANDDGKLPPEVLRFLREVRAVAEATNEEIMLGGANPHLAVVSWRPGDENEIAVILRSKVVGP